MVATEWLHSAPQDIASAVLVNTSMRPFSPMHRRLRPHNLPTLLRLVFGRPSPDAVQDFLAAGFEERHVLYIVLAIAVKTLSNFSNHAFGTTLDDRFAAYELVR